MVLIVALLYSSMSDALPVQPFEAHFDVYYKGFPIGAGIIKLSDSGNGHYELSSEVESSGLATLFYPYKVSGLSKGSFVGAVPRPSSYHQYQAIGGEEHISKATFDWRSRRVDAHFDERRRALKLRPRVVDPLSLFALAMGDLKRGVKASKYRLINRIYVSTYTVTNHGAELLDTPLGQLNTLRVSRQRKGSTKRTTLWFASDWNHVPVQVVHDRNGSEHIRLTVNWVAR